MKALPLWQPWASLVAIGAKRVETRSWPAPLGIVGQRIAIHATKGGLSKSEELDLLMRHEVVHAFEEATGEIPTPADLPRGAIVCTAVLARCRGITTMHASQLEERNPREFAFGDYTPGRHAWVLEDVQPVDPPLPCRGSQGMFDAPPELGERLGGVMQLEGVA